MIKEYTSLGLMSGTSGDGIDASIVKSDGETNYEVILNKYFEYNKEIYKTIHDLKEKINTIKDLEKFEASLKDLEKNITLFHAKVANDITKNIDVDLVGFHGQTIYHSSIERISKQLGNGELLSQLTKKNIVYNFRQNDIKNGGEGAPLTPLFHQSILKKNKIDVPCCILNIGGISNVTFVDNYHSHDFISRDIGPGNCLIDFWVRKNSNKKFDKDGELASIGKTNEIILEQAQELYSNRKNRDVLSLDINDFDASFARGLSLEDGVATLTDFTGRIIGAALSNTLPNVKDNVLRVLLSGGGRKNKSLINIIKNRILKNIVIQPIDDYGIDGDFVESQAFAYLAIRSYLKLPISFPKTTGCKEPSLGGEIIKVR
tara:strand:- start:896 stop:2017 length:1122 start_codon:yes stop_codon:yes gene_type:complete